MHILLSETIFGLKFGSNGELYLDNLKINQICYYNLPNSIF